MNQGALAEVIDAFDGNLVPPIAEQELASDVTIKGKFETPFSDSLDTNKNKSNGNLYAPDATPSTEERFKRLAKRPEIVEKRLVKKVGWRPKERSGFEDWAASVESEVL